MLKSTAMQLGVISNADIAYAKSKGIKARWCIGNSKLLKLLSAKDKLGKKQVEAILDDVGVAIKGIQTAHEKVKYAQTIPDLNENYDRANNCIGKTANAIQKALGDSNLTPDEHRDLSERARLISSLQISLNKTYGSQKLAIELGCYETHSVF